MSTKVGEPLYDYVCPECGGIVINDGFDDWDTLILNCHCEDCDWEGTEETADIRGDDEDIEDDFADE